MSKDDGIDEWRKMLKRILKKTSLSVSQHVLFISDAQMTDDQFLEDLNYLLYSGEVPILFSTEEKAEIVENMRTAIEPQLPKGHCLNDVCKVMGFGTPFTPCHCHTHATYNPDLSF